MSETKLTVVKNGCDGFLLVQAIIGTRLFNPETEPMWRNQKTNDLFPVQMKLDFGQKDVGSIRCSTCGMVYTRGDREDEKLHNTFHRKLFPLTVKLPRGRHQRILEELFGGSRIVELLLTDRIGVATFSRISSLMDRDLGCDCPVTQNTTTNNDAGTTSIPTDWRVFVSIQDGNQEVTGCVVIQILTPDSTAYQVRPLTGGLKSLLTWRLQASECDTSSLSENSSKTYPQSANLANFDVLCGVRRLWVREKHRRKGTATRLLECVLKNLIYGHPLKRDQIAFTDLTADGANFASKFVGHENILLY